MAQHDYNLANQTGLSFRADLNAALEAIVSNNSGATEPATPFAYQLWVDTSAAPAILKIRNETNTSWVTLGDVSAANLGLLLKSGGTMTGALLAAAGSVSAPGVAFDGDSDTGVYSPAANAVSLAAGGTEVLRGSSSGVELVGTGATRLPVGTTAQRPGTPVEGQVRYNSTLATFEGYKAGAWSEIGASAAGSRSGRNRIMNGSFQVDQRNRGQEVTAAFSYVVDRWRTGSNSFTGTCVVGQNKNALTSLPDGFTTYFGMQFTATATMSGSTASTRLGHYIEGYQVEDLAWGTASAKAVTLSFWVRSSLTGTFGGRISNSAGSRVYIFSYTIIAANTWEKKTITIAGDTGGAGTWLKGTDAGIYLQYCTGAGASRLIAPGSWGAIDADGPTGHVNLSETLNSTIYFTGVQLEAGTVASDFEQKPFAEELEECKRYFQKSYVYSAGTGSTNSSGIVVGRPDGVSTDRLFVYGQTLQREMRTVPTITVYSAGGLINSVSLYSNSATTISVSSINTPGSKTIAVYLLLGSAGNGATHYNFHYIANADF
jgi:hypothetical protein